MDSLGSLPQEEGLWPGVYGRRVTQSDPQYFEGAEEILPVSQGTVSGSWDRWLWFYEVVISGCRADPGSQELPESLEAVV